ncbi:DUF1801 domain-containing protein [Flavobacterium capsici]|uniref:DUF1801 domain-containing protein n=1 Tax=Flavobacterium capsici TaxID=3075618 RepID=A0AA96F220_9FLAO|nr:MULTISPECIES: DUF1801 domain-containing protein [unclassified Flavobacterium]WNM18542.1 DUF1801 domain-containing protein [Flavobacterium sp. PMR2A8]WNM22593.1 DUF1801 domain-containing protein [Flavobacterium sp. PMTSA4]
MKPTDLYILNQPDKFKDILLHIISVIENNLPNSTLEYKWNVPYFYYKKKPFCYLNASHKHGFVDVGFAKGFQLKNNLEYLIADNGRNTVKSLRYKSLEEIDSDILISVVKEAKLLY